MGCGVGTTTVGKVGYTQKVNKIGFDKQGKLGYYKHMKLIKLIS